ncbi:MAG: hypothetical protein EBS19_01940, partial [Spirochaetia bacterium]|nr:hypothetical protein [Spirochaetia bacterium]
MKYIDSFYNFAPNDGTPNLNELFSLSDEGGFMAKYNFESFKNLFSAYLNESDSYMDDESIEELHSCYEMSMLAETRSSWDNIEGEVNYIDVETHVILIKNSEAFVVEKKTFDTIQNIDESWFGNLLNKGKEKLKSIKNKIVSRVKEKISQAKDFVSRAWDKISDGAKKAWEWMKTAVAAAGKFIGDNIETITIVLSILSAVFGIAGGLTTAVGIGPILTTIGGVLMALNGGLHVYEGFHKGHHAMKLLKNSPIDPVSKYGAAIVKAGPDFFLGMLFIPLGFYDISHGLTEALVNPSAGSVGMAVKTTAKKAAKSWVGSLGHTIEKVLGGFIKEFFKNPKLGAKIGAAAVGVTSVVVSKFFTDVCGWLYEFMLKSSVVILKGIDWLLDIPKKLTDAISKFSKTADGVLTKLIAKGLDVMVKPMTSFLARINEKYFKPLVKKSKEFIQRQIEAKKILDAEMQKSHGGHGKGEDNKKHESIQKTKGKPLVKKGEVKIDKKDAKYIKA